MTSPEAEARAESRRRRKNQVKQARVVRYLKDFAKPSYHWHSFRDDLKAARHALANRELDELRDDPIALAKAFRGRMFACYVLAGPFGAIGLIAGTAIQYIWKNPYFGYLSTVIINNIIITVVFQIIWAVAHKRLYAEEVESRSEWFQSLQRDLLPVQLRAFKYALLVMVFVVPFIIGTIKLVEIISVKAALAIPFAPLGAALELAVQNVTLVRLIGDLFDRHSKVLAERHKNA